MAYTEIEAKELVIEAGKRLVETGLITRTWGNISARISDTQFVVTPSGRAYETLTPDQIVVVNIADGTYEGDIKPSGEKGIHLDAYELHSELVAGTAEVGDRHLLAVKLVLLDDSALDRHTVVIPTGNVGRIVTLHRLILYDKVLKNLVKRGTHVNITVGEGRAIVKNKGLLAFVSLKHCVIKILCVHSLKHIRLTCRKVCPHRKLGLGQI